ncbi:MAG TPA: STAS domain-containing protein [Leptospiraceae bacterium]|jgi:anti-anti-sigma factor|nr:STAS domain-containing protein [Leptospiraceae bacterium]HNL67790.1 STAS domain-containing protein [Leptospiraceae bacterium]HNN73428.1 STAS domain-containing protein [Leptospiraceae bacterium]
MSNSAELEISEILPFEKGFRVNISGPINIYSAGQLTNAIIKKTTDGMKLAVDLSKVPMVDSSGIGFLIRLARDLEKKKGKVILCGVTDDFKSNLTALRVDKLVRLASSAATIPADFWD